MNFAMTQWEEGIIASSESKKVAKLSSIKVNNIDNKYKKLRANETETAKALKTVGLHDYKGFLERVKVSVLKNGPVEVMLSGARKLRVNSIVRDGSLKLFTEAINGDFAVESPVVTNTAPMMNDVTEKEPVNNIVQFPSRVSKEEKPVMEPQAMPNNIVNFPTERVMERREMSDYANSNVVNTNVNSNANNVSGNNTFSRLSRFDYNTSNNLNVEEKAPMESSNVTASRDNVVSIDDYLQHSLNSNSDRDIQELVQSNERLDNEIAKKDSILENLKVELQKIQTIREEKHRAQINALEEEKLSKTTRLDGLTEQILALQEAIEREQQSLNDSTSYRRIA